MINRGHLKSKLESAGFKYANIGKSTKLRSYVLDDLVQATRGNEVLAHFNSVVEDTYSIEMLRESDIEYIMEALYFYSKSKNYQVEELRQEYMVMRRMLEK